jgi:hypothetical protein
MSYQTVVSCPISSLGSAVTWSSLISQSNTPAETRARRLGSFASTPSAIR